MQLDQFDELKELIDEIILKLRQAKFKNIKLEKENIESKKEIQLIEQIPEDFDLNLFKKLQSENERLKNKNKEVKIQLQTLASKLEQKMFLKSGVDS